MIDRNSKLSITRQCDLLQLPRSTAYYMPVEVSEAVLMLMRLIDELHLQYPFAGSRMMRGLLKKAGHKVGRRHVRTLMRKMGIDALYRMFYARPKRSGRKGGNQPTQERRWIVRAAMVAAPIIIAYARETRFSHISCGICPLSVPIKSGPLI